MGDAQRRDTGRPSIRDVARRAGVSPSCVSNVLNRRRSQSDQIGRAVLAAVADLGYRPNPIASDLRRASSRFIGVVIPDFENPFFGRLVAELERCAEAGEFRIVAASSREDPAAEAREIAEFMGWRVAGLLWVPATGSDIPARLAAADGPVVVLDRITGAAAVDEIGVDNARAAATVVAALAAAGHREVLLATSEMATINIAERVSGALEAARAHGLAITRVACGASIESSVAALEAHLARHAMPTAIFGLNNLAALAALGAIQRRGLVPGRDVALASFDDSAWMAHMHPRVAAVAQPVAALARAGWERLLARIDGDAAPARTTRLACRFEPRDTLGPPRARRDSG